MNAYEKAQQLGLTGTDEQIVTVLQSLTSSPIPVAAITRWFADNGLGAYDPLDGIWTGALIKIAKAPDTPKQISDGLRKLFTFLGDRTTTQVNTTDPAVSMQFAAVVGMLLQGGTITSEQAEAFYALDGGRPFATLTVDEFAAQRKAAEDEAAARAVIDKLSQDWAHCANALGINVALAAGNRVALIDSLKSSVAFLEG